MTLTPGAYLKHRRTAAGMSVGDVAASLSAAPHMAEHVRAEQLELIEADAQPMIFSTVAVLRQVFPFDAGVLMRLAELHAGAALPLPRMCRICACSEWDACRGRCSWAEPDLCTSCTGMATARAIAT